MLRPWMVVLLAGFGFAASVAEAATAPAPASSAPAPAAQPLDLFSVAAVKVDATAESATAARDLAMSQGRLQAWTKLYRRFTASALWSKASTVPDTQLQRLMRSFEVANERRSTTRYLAEVTFHFNPAAVRAFLRQSGIAFTEQRSRPALVIPVITGGMFDPMSPWAMAWTEPSLQQGLVPFVMPQADTPDLAILMRPDLLQVDWAGFAPMARRYNATSVILAVASEDAKSVQVIQLSATARAASTLAYAQSSFPADAEAVAEKAAEAWKTRAAVNYGQSARIVADVTFESPADWTKIRTSLANVRAISNVEVVGIALHEAEIGVTYFGRPEQLHDALAQQNLDLDSDGGKYTLQIAGATAANTQ
nr:hypothetical protein Hi04_10k_c4983_00034 [uncultured bacterium]